MYRLLAELDISLEGNSSQNLFEVNAQNATVINLSGSVAGEDEVTVRINDADTTRSRCKHINC